MSTKPLNEFITKPNSTVHEHTFYVVQIFKHGNLHVEDIIKPGELYNIKFQLNYGNINWSDMPLKNYRNQDVAGKVNKQIVDDILVGCKLSTTIKETLDDLPNMVAGYQIFVTEVKQKLSW